MNLAHKKGRGTRSRQHDRRLRDGHLGCEALEERRLLTSDALNSSLDALWSTTETMPVAAPLSLVDTVEPLVGTASPGGFTPTQIRHAYGFDQISFDGGTIQGDGTGQTIAIIDAYHDPNIASDLASFDAYFGLSAPPSFTQVDQNGGTNYTGTNGSWATETALDVEWAHALAPGASILLVEANSANFSDLTAAVDYARNVPAVSVITMSWGVSEFFGETSYDHYFTTPVGHTGVTFFGAAGDSGGPGVYPAYSPNVTAVGGTTLSLDGSNNILNETVWNDGTHSSGGGISQYEAKPSWQNGVANQSATKRVMPDVAFDANPSTGVPIYDTFNNASNKPWSKVGGTSFSAPAWAALVAIANQGRTLVGLPVFDTTSLMTKLYSMPASNFNDITSGTSGGSIPQSAGVGFDAVTGRGSPKGALIVASLVDASTAPAAVDLVAASDTGISNSDDLTRLNNSSGGSTLQFTVTGTIAGATVNVYADGTLIGTAVAGGATTVVTTSGSYTLTDGLHNITARQVEPSKGLSDATSALPVTVDTTAPVATFVAVTPDPRTTPVSSVSLQFNEVVSGLNLAALSLTRDAGANLLSGTQTITTVDGMNWSLNNLSGITALSGVYQLVLTSATDPVIDAAGNVAGNAAESFTVTAGVLGRMLFYNNSTFDGSNVAINAADDGAIAPDKTAYLAGSGIASFSNVSSYLRGLNGVMVDITGSHAAITANDFTFRVGSNNSPETWSAAPSPLAVSVRAGAGANGGDRIEITWADGAIEDEWLEVTLMATANTGLPTADIFYFGNLVGDTGVNSAPTLFTTNAADEITVRQNPGFGVGLSNSYDFDRNGLVNASDQIIARTNSGFLTRIDLSTPAAPRRNPPVRLTIPRVILSRHPTPPPLRLWRLHRPQAPAAHSNTTWPSRWQSSPRQTTTTGTTAGMRKGRLITNCSICFLTLACAIGVSSAERNRCSRPQPIAQHVLSGRPNRPRHQRRIGGRPCRAVPGQTRKRSPSRRLTMNSIAGFAMRL